MQALLTICVWPTFFLFAFPVFAHVDSCPLFSYQCFTGCCPVEEPHLISSEYVVSGRIILAKDNHIFTSYVIPMNSTKSWKSEAASYSPATKTWTYDRQDFGNRANFLQYNRKTGRLHRGASKQHRRSVNYMYSDNQGLTWESFGKTPALGEAKADPITECLMAVDSKDRPQFLCTERKLNTLMTWAGTDWQRITYDLKTDIHKSHINASMFLRSGYLDRPYLLDVDDISHDRKHNNTLNLHFFTGNQWVTDKIKPFNEYGFNPNETPSFIFDVHGDIHAFSLVSTKDQRGILYAFKSIRNNTWSTQLIRTWKKVRSDRSLNLQVKRELINGKYLMVVLSSQGEGAYHYGTKGDWKSIDLEEYPQDFAIHKDEEMIYYLHSMRSSSGLYLSRSPLDL
ncbi:MAG: hypothetical protein ACRBBP_01280 [Bdellovibrionales bacterium]